MTENDFEKLEAVQKRVKELEELVATLQIRLRSANDLIDQYQKQASRDSYDYLPCDWRWGG